MKSAIVTGLAATALALSVGIAAAQTNSGTQYRTNPNGTGENPNSPGYNVGTGSAQSTGPSTTTPGYSTGTGSAQDNRNGQYTQNGSNRKLNGQYPQSSSNESSYAKHPQNSSDQSTRTQ